MINNLVGEKGVDDVGARNYSVDSRALEQAVRQ